MTSFDAYVAEVRELQDRLRREEDIPEEELDQLLERLAFLREQIDLARQEVEGSRLAALRELHIVQEELDNEKSP